MEYSGDGTVAGRVYLIQADVVFAHRIDLNQKI